MAFYIYGVSNGGSDMALHQKSITDTILKFKGHITIIAIAHRLSTLAECDYKIDFKDGLANRL